MCDIRMSSKVCSEGESFNLYSAITKGEVREGSEEKDQYSKAEMIMSVRERGERREKVSYI